MFGVGCGHNSGHVDQIATHMSGTKPMLLVYSHTRRYAMSIAIRSFPFMIIRLGSPFRLLSTLFESVYPTVVIIHGCQDRTCQTDGCVMTGTATATTDGSTNRSRDLSSVLCLFLNEQLSNGYLGQSYI